MLSKEDAEGNVTIVIPPDHSVTGHSSDGRHTTFFTRSGGSFRTRAIDEEKAGWFMLSPALICLYCLVTASVLLSGHRIEPDMAFFFVMLCIAVILGGARAEGFAWKELFLMGAVAQLLTQPLDLGNSETWLAFGFAALALVAYVVSWVRDAVWEPFAIATAFLGLLLAFRFGIVPDRAMGLACCFLFFCSFMGILSIAGSSALNSRGWSTMREY